MGVVAAGGLVLKQVAPRGIAGALRFGLQRSASRQVYRFGRELRVLGIPTPRPLAWATVRRLGLRARDYLLTEEVGDARALTQRLLDATIGRDQRGASVRQSH